jgi:hypothetical protein
MDGPVWIGNRFGLMVLFPQGGTKEGNQFPSGGVSERRLPFFVVTLPRFGCRPGNEVAMEKMTVEERMAVIDQIMTGR